MRHRHDTTWLWEWEQEVEVCLWAVQGGGGHKTCDRGAKTLAHVPNQVQTTLVYFQKRRSLMCREGEVTKGKKRGCLERSETDNVSFGGNDLFKRENDTVDRGTGHKDGDAVGSVWPQ